MADKKIGRNDACWCGSGLKYKQCHMEFDKKIFRYALEGHTVPSHKLIKNEEQIQKIRESAKINVVLTPCTIQVMITIYMIKS